MAVYLHRVGAESEPAGYRWGPRACSLYALAVGAGIDDLAFTTEGNAGVLQRVYPTFALAIVAEVSSQWPDPCFGTGDFPLERVVLGEQGLVVHQPLLPEGVVTVRTRVASIHDKGSAALVVLEARAIDAASGEAVFTSTVDMFVTGEGGFGGPARQPTGSEPMPARSCDRSMEMATLPVQTLLYRHGGNDANPAHVDPQFALRAGWAGPILAGQNTLGIACRAVVHGVTDGDPSRIRSVRGRFVAPASNGDVLRTEMWLEDADGRDLVRFRVVDQHARIVIDRGLVELR
jgi:acyl dehydratase